MILCGGRGARLGEHGVAVPKALIEIGGRPTLWHLLHLYARQGFSDFVLCLGCLGDEIKGYFVERQWRENDFTIEMNGNREYPIIKWASETAALHLQTRISIPTPPADLGGSHNIW